MHDTMREKRREDDGLIGSGKVRSGSGKEIQVSLLAIDVTENPAETTQ